MLGDLGRFFTAMFSNEVSFVFCATLFAIFFLAFFMRRMESPLAKEFCEHTQATLATVGVLGTFFGIYIGLLDFDVKDIDGSIPKLLDGLKLAFVTSILGMALGITYRTFSGFLQPEEQKEASSD